jgi:uncharacterized protein (TIGR01244 family)
MRLEDAVNPFRCLVTAALVLALATSAVADETTWKYRFEPADGITAAGQPNEAEFKELANDGYAAVIDLRTAGEDRGLDEETTVEELGMDYIELPIAGRDDINFENAKKLHQILSNYDEPVLVHCGSSNRVGALFALRAKMNGANDEDALAFGKSAGMTSLESTVKTRLDEI